MVCIFRCFPENSLVDPGKDPLSQSKHAFFSENFKDFSNKVVGLDFQITCHERPHSEKGGGSCSNSTHVKKVFPHEYYSTPHAKSRFNCLYGNEALNKNVKNDELPESQIHQTEGVIWVNNVDEVTNVENYKHRTKKCDHQSPSSEVSKHADTDMWYEHHTEDSDDNVSVKPYSLYSPTKSGSPVLRKSVTESTNGTNILSSPSSSAYSSINMYSDWSTKDELEQVNHKRKLDSDYTSENRFLHPVEKFKLKHHKAEKDLLYTAKSRNVSNWKPDCEYFTNNLEYVNPNTDQKYLIEYPPSICRHCNSDTLHDEVESSAYLTSWCRVKCTRWKQTVRVLTKPSGLPESAPRNQIINSETECSLPSEWDSFSENKVRILYFYPVYTFGLTTFFI
jgi:hypothetical protein